MTLAFRLWFSFPYTLGHKNAWDTHTHPSAIPVASGGKASHGFTTKAGVSAHAAWPATGSCVWACVHTRVGFVCMCVQGERDGKEKERNCHFSFFPGVPKPNSTLKRISIFLHHDPVSFLTVNVHFFLDLPRRS